MNVETKAHPALRAIAIYKLVKAFGLLIVAGASFGLVRETRLEALAKWVEELPIQHGHHFLVELIDTLTGMAPSRFIVIGVVACIYASVFIVEGWGLWRGKRWAEYLTVIATASLIPFEIWEIARHVTALKIGALVLNVAIVLYLIHLLRRHGK